MARKIVRMDDVQKPPVGLNAEEAALVGERCLRGEDGDPGVMDASLLPDMAGMGAVAGSDGDVREWIAGKLGIGVGSILSFKEYEDRVVVVYGSGMKRVLTI